MTCELILGGARSGKSREAERRAAESGLAVTVIATAEALDDEMAARIRRHQADRPTAWRTVEAPLALADTLRREAAPARCVVVDCLTLWVSNLLADAHTLPAGATAEDLLQETYLRVTRALSERAIDHLEPFVFQTARNLALDHLRARKIHSRTMVDDVPQEIVHSIAAPASSAARPPRPNPITPMP